MARAAASPAPVTRRDEPLEGRILGAAARCAARWGLTKTTIDDIAREARCSRATVYRAFPGGKDVIVLATAAGELHAFFATLDAEMVGAESLEDALVIGLTVSCTSVRDHPVLQYLVAHEPEVLGPYLAFDGLDPLLVQAAQFAAPRLSRFVDERTARELGELMARLVAAYAFDTAPRTDLCDRRVTRRFVRAYVLPGVAIATRSIPKPDHVPA